MRYCCEECGKTFTKEEEALTCENKHKEEKAKAEKLEKEKQERLNEVVKAYDKYIEKLNKYREDYISNVSVHTMFRF